MAEISRAREGGARSVFVFTTRGARNEAHLSDFELFNNDEPELDFGTSDPPDPDISLHNAPLKSATAILNSLVQIRCALKQPGPELNVGC